MGGLNAGFNTCAVEEYHRIEGGGTVESFAFVLMLRAERSCPTVRMDVYPHYHIDGIRVSGADDT